MSQEVGQNELKVKTQLLMDGPLKHVKAAALAAALLPLASVAASAQTTQVTCPASASAVCGYVFNDANKNGNWDWDQGELGIEGVKVTIVDEITKDTIEVETGPGGIYYIDLPQGSYTVAAQIPTGVQTSPINPAADQLTSNDGKPNGAGYSYVSSVQPNGFPTDFGFFDSPAPNPGTGTPGYWKNHPEAWPVDAFGVPVKITIGAYAYTKDQAIAWLKKVGKDKTTTMFSSLVSAMLNVKIGVRGSAGVQYGVALKPAGVNVSITPKVQVAAYGQGGIDLGIAEGGVGAELTLLKSALAPWLPKEILRRPKMGFAMPLREWLRADLQIDSEHSGNRPVASVVDPAFTASVRAAHLGGQDRTAVLHGLAFLDYWLERWA
jgi:hypothetical protein